MSLKTLSHDNAGRLCQARYFRQEELAEALDVCRSMIKKGSKSFSLSAHVFGKEIRNAAFALYGWCRYCDDQIDDSHLGFRTTNNASDTKSSLDRLADLTRLTHAAYAGERMTDPVFMAFQYVTHTYKIPLHYPLELLEGMAMDIRQNQYETIHDLMLYCYRVAGTVGLMMSHIMGISDERALHHAASLGKAMQLTNIARDVFDDAKMGRVYLPQDWLRELNMDLTRLQAPEAQPKLAQVVKRLLAVADVLYQSGDRGLPYLPFRAACAIASARQVYSEIGAQVRARGEKAWDERTVIPKGRKLNVMAKGVAQVMTSLPRRLFSPWRPTSIQTIWRHT